jgi:hypothetical protein
VADKLQPRTAIDRGPAGEEAIELDQNRPETIAEGGGDSAANEIDTNVGGAPATLGQDSGGAVGVRRGREVGRPGFEYDTAPDGMTDEEVRPLVEDEEELAERRADLPEWADNLQENQGV